MNNLDEILESAKRGDETAKEKIFDYLYVRFKTFATYKVGEGQSHDIAMEACTIVLQKFNDLEITQGFESWAGMVLTNVLRNYYRTSKIRNGVMVPELNSERRLEFSSEPDYHLKLTFYDCLDKILESHPRYARVLNLVINGYKTDEISKKLKTNPKHVYVILNRGRKLLEKCLETGGI
jgi:RNA polymerase sigma factor (sigma-70 family)